MHKIRLIIEREYVSRVRKKSFIILSILGPLLFAMLIFVPVLIAQMGGSEKTIEILDESGLFSKNLELGEDVKVKYVQGSLEDVKKHLSLKDDSKADAILFIPKKKLTEIESVQLYFEKNISSFYKLSISRALNKELESLKLIATGIDRDVLESTVTRINIQTIQLSGGTEKQSNSEIAFGLGYGGAFVIYFFIFFFGAQVMRGVMEEKTNRIIEVIISSVKPFELMMGKIIGIALVALTQFAIWIALGAVCIFALSLFGADTQEIMSAQQNPALQQAMAESSVGSEKAQEIMQGINAVPMVAFVVGLVFYFLFGYLMYGSLFAAVGSAVDSEADSQQFSFPITIPLIIAIICAMQVAKDPGGSLAFWTSMIPFTSPVIMVIRIPTGGVEVWEILLSMFFLIIGFVGSTYLASRIYRVGILMHGKKITYKELYKWLKIKT